MALPPSGTITLTQIQAEFGGSNPISLSEYYRGGGLVTSNNTNVPTSGTISLSNFYGAVKQFAFTISTSYSSTQDLRTLAFAAGWNGSDPVVATISAGVIISSSSTSVAALTIAGSFPAGVLLVNNGSIVGMGGRGGEANAAGSPGGAAVAVSTAVSITNNGTFAGGGGEEAQVLLGVGTDFSDPPPALAAHLGLRRRQPPDLCTPAPLLAAKQVNTTQVPVCTARRVHLRTGAMAGGCLLTAELEALGEYRVSKAALWMVRLEEGTWGALAVLP